MRKFKRMIALITVALFVLSFAAPAGAATKEEAFGRLKALGVAVGDASGNPLYDKTFTRAEAAAIMVNMSGMNAAIEAAKGPTKFKDVPANHWATGVINLAVGAGIIKGYPDGTYKPDKEVSYAEMSAMLIGVLNYTPKLQGTWPSNVIGKAAQLGLLDGLAGVTDFNAAAVRSNVFIAVDKATTVKPLKETKDGYEEDTKTLMERRLSVEKKAEGVVSQVPLTSGNKNKVTVGSETLDVISSLDVNPLLGLKVEPWVKDDKVFFLDVKTASSDIITDTIKAIDGVTNNPGATNQTITAGRKIKVSKLDKEYTVASSFTVYKNFSTSSPTVSVGDEVKLILDSDGKIKTLIASSFTRRLIDKVDATNEKLTFKGDGAPGGSEDLKNKVAVILKGGNTISLSAIKVGDIIDYIKNGDNYYIIVSDATVSGKLTGVAEDGLSAANAKKFKVTIDGKEYKLVGAAGSAYYSTDDGKNYSAINNTSDLTSVIGQNVTGLLNKGGSIAYLKAGDTTATGEFIALVRYTKVVDIGELKRYIYVTKSDGTNTYYEVTKDAKIDGVTINEDILKNAGSGAFEIATTGRAKEVVANEVVKMTLTSDGKVNNIKKFAEGDWLNVTWTEGTPSTWAPAGAGIAVDKNADAININSTGYVAVNADTKIFKVKTNNPDGTINEAEMATWTSVEAIPAGSGAGQLGTVSAVAIKDGGVAKVVVIYNTNANLSLASDFKYGFLAEIGYDGKDYLKINEGATEATKKEGTTAAFVEDLVRFKVSSTDKFTDVSDVTKVSTGNVTYAYYKLSQVNSGDKQLKLVRCDVDGNEEPGGSNYFKFYEPTKVKVFDISGTNSVVYVSDINEAVGKVVNVYNAYDKDGKDIENGGDSNDQIIDFIAIVKK